MFSLSGCLSCPSLTMVVLLEKKPNEATPKPMAVSATTPAPMPMSIGVKEYSPAISKTPPVTIAMLAKHFMVNAWSDGAVIASLAKGSSVRG